MFITSIDIGGTFIKSGLVEIKDSKIILHRMAKARIIDSNDFNFILIIINFFDFIFENSIFSINTEVINDFTNYLSNKDLIRYFNENFNKFIKYFKNPLNFNFVDLPELIFPENKKIDKNKVIGSNNNSKLSIDIISIALPGFPDNESKKLLSGSPNLVAITQKSFKDYFKKKIHLINDVSAQGYFYKHAGEGINLNNFIVIALGTGIGGALIFNNNVYLGKNGWAGEIGHLKLYPFYPGISNCKSKGICYEMEGSVRALINKVNKLLNLKNLSLTGEIILKIYKCLIKYKNKENLFINKQKEIYFKNNYEFRFKQKFNSYIFEELNSILIDFLRNDLKINDKIKLNNNVTTLFEKIIENDDFIIHTVEKWFEVLGSLTGGLINLLNPEAIIFSGGISENEPEIVKFIEKYSKNYCYPIMFENCNFIAGKNSSLAGVTGSAIYVWQKLNNKL